MEVKGVDVDSYKKIYLEVKGVDVEDMYTNKIMLRWNVTPQRVTLPDGWSFLARYERVSRENLLSNATIRRYRTIGPRRQRKHRTQQGTGRLGSVFNLWKKDLHISSRATSEIGKKVINEGIKHGPELHNYGTKKVKMLKRHWKQILQMTLLSKLKKKYLTGKMCKRITNFQIEAALINFNNEDLNDNFVGVFPANEMKRFIYDKSMISEKRANILS